MKNLATTVTTASLSLLATTDVAYAGAPDWLLNIPAKYWIDIIVLLLILNLICCWWRKP